MDHSRTASDFASDFATSAIEDLRLDHSWDCCLDRGDMHSCLGIIQVAGWDLLGQYLNGGLGRTWWLYPRKMGCSSSLIAKAGSLVRKWELFSQTFGISSPMASGRSGVATVLCLHYQGICSLLSMLNGYESEIACQPSVQMDIGKPLRKLVQAAEELQPHLVSYWFHGSLGSGETKPYWSDVDALAVVATRAFESPARLNALRSSLIAARSYMLDFMPFQLHGHFVLAEPDLKCYPSSMFPSVLFRDASCVLSDRRVLTVRERQDVRMAKEMLWEHSIADLLLGEGARGNMHQKIVFLHRVYLLPCLVTQVAGQPLFKRNAFEKLDDLFTRNEASCIREVSSVWHEWKPPAPHVRASIMTARIARFNPLLYQFLSHKVGGYLPWIKRKTPEYWARLGSGMSAVARSVWARMRAWSPEDV